MLNNKKHKVLLLSMVLLLVIGAGSVIAFIVTKTDNVENQFTPSHVSCEVSEVMENNVKKEVKITNTGDTTAFIRAQVVATWVKPVDGSTTEYETYGKAPEKGVDYEIVYDDEANNPEKIDWFKKDGFWYYEGPVLEETATAVLIASCTPVGNNAPEDYILSVEIIAEAIQAAGGSEVGDPAVWTPAATQAWGVTVNFDENNKPVSITAPAEGN